MYAHGANSLTKPPKYRAFISYSHRDAAWGDWLHKGLESYRVPKPLIGRETRVGPVPARLFPVFRDREELPTTSDLSHAIDDALRSSLFLIVMCSPSAAASQWVNEEIRAFKHLHGEDQILAIIVDGEPNATDKGAPEDECFPEALRFRLDPGGRLTTERTEPIAADARPQGDGKEDALLKLLSGLLAVNFNDLKQREIQAARKRARIAQGIAAAMALLAIAALGAGWVAFQNQQIAEEQTAIAIAQRQIAEAETRRADAARKVADEQRQIAEARLREALIERTGPTIADGRAAAQQGAVETAMANAHAALASALDIEDAALTAQAAQFGRDLVLDDRLEAVLEGRYPVGLAIPRLRNAEISETGNVIMVRRGDQLLLWQRLTGALLLRLKGVETAAFRPDGGIGGILAGGQVFAVAPDTGQATLVKTLTAGSGAPAPVSRASASPGGRFAAVLSGDALSLVDLITGNTAQILALDGGATRQFAWSADGRYLAAIDSEPPRARFWSTESRNAVADITPAGAVNAIRIDQDIALIDADGGLGIVNLLTGQTAIPADVDRVDDILIGADGRVIVAPALGPPLVLSPDGVTETTVGTEAVFGLVGLRADGREVLVRGATQFALHDVETGDLIRKIGPSGSVPAAFHLAKSGDYLAILGEDGVVTVWSLGDGRQTFTYRPQHRVEWLTMLDAPMGALLMIQNREGSVSLHRAEPSRLFGTGLVSFDAPLANGLIAVNGYYPTPARLWDIATRHPVSDLPGPVMAADPVTGRLLTRDGADLAVTHLDANKVELHAREPRIVHATFGANEHLALQTPEAVLLINTKTGATLGKWSAV
ncbi:MAG: TIR domain-containing protein, partial [Pikeienuella sp.]